MGGVRERKEVDVLLTDRVKAGNSSNFFIEVVVSDLSRSNLGNRRQLDKVSTKREGLPDLQPKRKGKANTKHQATAQKTKTHYILLRSSNV